MPGFIVLSLDVGCATLALYALWHFLSRKSNRFPFPPGPIGRPIIKNLLDWPAHNGWETFVQWGHKYGDLMHADIMGQHMIVVNSYETAVDLLQRKAAIYSGRPSLYFGGKMVGYDQATSLIVDTGSEWKEQRDMFAHHIGSQKALERFLPVSRKHTRRFLCQLLDDPGSEQLYHYVRTLAGSITLDITYGYDVQNAQDPLISLAEEVLLDISWAFEPGSHLVDIIPLLGWLPSWFPGAEFKKEAVRMRARLEDLLKIPFEFTKQNMTVDAVQNSFVGSHYQREGLSSKEIYSLQWTAATMYAAGADTTVSYMYTFFLVMTANPQIQAKAQAEIDSVIGSGRLPTVADRMHLPFLNALVLEIFRYGNVLPLGVPHRSVKHDVHDGYYIPKDSFVIPNAWAMSRDPRTYKNPDVFDPSRFLGEHPERDPRSHMFGFGKRICAGRLMADNNVFLMCAMAIATLNISKAVGPDGNEITPMLELEGGILTQPKRFPCIIKSRSLETEELLRADSTV